MATVKRTKRARKPALEAQREAAAYTSDIGSSLEDSESSVHRDSSDYEVDEIQSRRFRDDEEDGEIPEYLVKFANYPQHRNQWVTKRDMSAAAIESWKEKRMELGDKLENFCRVNERRFSAAVNRADKAKQRRRQKREQARQEAAQKKGKKGKKAALPTQGASSAQDVTASARTRAQPQPVLSVRRRVVVDSSEDDSSEDEPLSITRVNLSRKAKSRQTEIDNSSTEEPLIERRTKLTSLLPQLGPGSHAKEATQPSNPEQRRMSVAENSLSVKSSGSEAAPATATAGPSVSKRHNVPQDKGPIKIINAPKQPQRKPWDTHDKLYKKLHFRAVAEKRSRKEGTPDINVLDFVNGAPAGFHNKPIDTTPQSPYDNLYGRRESGQRRLAEIEPECDPDPMASGVALRSYEAGKIPMACFDWKHGNNCHYGAEICRFLHREYDADGKLLPVTNYKGEVPGKYKDPPETCLFWLRDGFCKNNEDCRYAHENTGHLAVKSGTKQIDPLLEPATRAAREACGIRYYPDVTCWDWLRDTKGCKMTSEQCNFAHRNTGVLGNTIGADFKPINPDERPMRTRQMPKFSDPPQTCFFWLRGSKGCTKAADDCNYAHENTGWLQNLQRKLVSINPQERPVFDPQIQTHRSQQTNELPPRNQEAAQQTNDLPPQNQYIPLRMKTCWYWNEGNCQFSANECRSLHRYTGVVAERPHKAKLPPGWQLQYRRDPEESDSSDKDGSEAMDIGYSSATDNEELRTMSADSPVPDSPQLVPRLMKSTMMAREIECAMNLDLDDMVRCNGDQYEDIVADNNAFLLYDSDEEEENTLIERWLLMKHFNVYSAFRMGLDAAWGEFKDLVLAGGSGIVIATPKFENFAALPNFGDVLRGTVRLWSVGHQPPAGWNMRDINMSEETPFDRFCIFPYGGIIYVTEDVFEKQPHLALSIFKHFFAKVDAGRKVDCDIIPGMYINDGILLWRIGVRPNLMQWLGDTCIEHQLEIDQGDPGYVSLHELYWLLNDKGYCDPDRHFDYPPITSRPDYYPVISMREGLAKNCGLYYEARSRSTREADQEMMEHYSGLFILERRNYRHYFVVHTEPETLDWKEMETTIDEVITPQRCIEYFEQEPKSCKFDNFEWTFPPKEADGVYDAAMGDEAMGDVDGGPVLDWVGDAPTTAGVVQDGECAACGLARADCPCDAI